MNRNELTLSQLVELELTALRAELERNIVEFAELELMTKEQVVTGTIRLLRDYQIRARTYYNGLEPSSTNTDRGAKLEAVKRFLAELCGE